MYSVPRCTNIARPLSCSSFMDERVHNLSRRRAENDRSHETLPTDAVRKIVIILCRVGKVRGLHTASAIEAVLGLSGGEIPSNDFFHFNNSVSKFSFSL